jgi:hypothetical protein
MSLKILLSLKKLISNTIVYKIIPDLMQALVVQILGLALNVKYPNIAQHIIEAIRVHTKRHKVKRKSFLYLSSIN